MKHKILLIHKQTSRFLMMAAACMVFTVTCSYGQSRAVSGTITDENGAPIPGVNVVEKGTTQGSITDEDGKYSLQVSENATLIFSFVGYSAQEVVVGSRTQIDIQIQPDVTRLSEVVVTGYSFERKADITGAVTVVDVDNIRKQAVANPMKALQGQVPGMYVTGTGAPDAPATIRIRGIGTLNDNDPLFVIDGVPTKSGINQLNPNDIESVQVLKDASAASIYGSRAGNGVIIITTKRGGAKGVEISANAYTSVAKYMTIPEMLNTMEYGRTLWQASLNSNLDPNQNGIRYNFDWQIDPTTSQPVLNNISLPEYLDPEQTLRTSDTDWFNEVSRTGVIRNYDLQIRNASENGENLLSIGYFSNDGVVKTTQFERLSLRLNSNYRMLGDKVTIGQNLSLSKTYNVSANIINAALQAVPLVPVRTEDGKGWGGPVSGMNDRQNPVRVLEDNRHNGVNSMRLFGNLYAEISLMKGLSFKSNFGLDYTNDYARNWQKRYHSGYLVNNVNKVTNSQSHSIKTIWTNTLNYNLHLNDHQFDVLAGVEQFIEAGETFSASREGYLLEDSDYMFLNPGTGIRDNSGIGSKNSLLSYFSRVNYSFLNRYFLSATFRYDGSSRFGENNRFGGFPAFSAGWRISDERFLAGKTLIDDLKLRFGWGKTGNQEINNNAVFNVYLPNYNTTSYDINGNKSGVLPSGYYLSQNANPNLRWEATTMSNLGIDFSIFDQKLYGSVDGYIKETSDILLLPPYVGVLGQGGNIWVNGASMENRGLEIQLGHRNNLGSDWSIDVRANVDFVRNKVTHLPGPVLNAYGGDGRGQNILGRTLGSFFGYVADGLFRTDEQVAEHAQQNGKGLGRIRFSDLNGDGVIDDYDRTWIGNPLPKFSAGLSSTVNYKSFDLSFLLQGLGSVDVRNEFKLHTDFWSAVESASNKGTRVLQAWSFSNSDSDIPAVTMTDNNWEARPSSYFIENGTYLKLRNVQLGYTLNQELLSRVRINSLRMYVGGDNLGILYKSKSFTGLDPESPAFGYPNPVVFTAGISTRF